MHLNSTIRMVQNLCNTRRNGTKYSKSQTDMWLLIMETKY